MWYQIYLFLRPNVKSTYLLRNLTYEIDIYDIHNFSTLFIIIFCVEIINNDCFLCPSLLNV